MFYTKTRNVKDPQRANATDAGIDFFVPEHDDAFVAKLNELNAGLYVTKDFFEIGPHQGALIPAGVKVIVPPKMALVAFNKSGVAVKQQLLAGACVVDVGYVGELHINVINSSHLTQRVKFGQKLMQFVLLHISQEEVSQISNEEYKKFENTDRGAGGFGSTGTN
jgi:dUTP pyrophosphatase